jgi:ATP adenylyltransferase
MSACDIVFELYTVRVERLFTPWRREFIESAASADKQAACFLCAAAAEQADEETLVVHRDQRVFVILNRYPYNSGHLLVAPYAHTGDLAALDAPTAADLMHISQRAVGILQEVYRPHAFNLGLNLGRTAGAGLPDHLHVHVVPRWDGDTNFMPIVGQTKVLPESLDQTYARLAPRFLTSLGG